ncbi:MAG: trans-2-enoyl-CoA reductase family protein [Verrucomicrobiota bacterium JB024]|nr:trans-2-enoyl-CoA reductase family protein [Verrucomicrobiota bacterium JB024]
MVIKPKIRGFVCITSHPAGCAAHVQEEIAHVAAKGALPGPKRVLVVGSSTGYGLSSRIVTAFGFGADTVGVFFERPSSNGRPASAGWYNTAAFTEAAEAKGLFAGNINGDAFSQEIKDKTVEMIREKLGQVDLVIYSLASPRRTDPETGEVFKSVLKPVGAPFTAKTLDTDKKLIVEQGIEPANEQEIADTVKVMGGEDWVLWMDALKAGGVLADEAATLAYSYIGPEVTHPIYRSGTIGKAKEHLENTAATLRDKGIPAWVAINKAVVTQASSAIPVVPLYVSILFKVMKEKGLHEGCIEQMTRLFAEKYGNGNPETDAEGRIRLDDWEMKPEIQEAVKVIWPTVTTENLEAVTDFAGYQDDFLKLFGFNYDAVDYDAETEPDVPLDA